MGSAPPPGGALHVWYALPGAALPALAVAPEVEALTGADLRSADAVERHAEIIADLFSSYYGI